MITLSDCLAMSDLTEEEVDAIAEHEHLPEILAAQLGNYLAHLPGGTHLIRRMIVDDMLDAQRRGDRRHERQLRLALRRFCQTHPDAAQP
jgi:hypothetical protein